MSKNMVRRAAILVLLLWIAVPALAEPDPVAEIKAELLTMAQSFAGQGDEDFSRQNALQPIIDRLLRAAPQRPVKDRLALLRGTWRQVWGPYDYRNEGRGVDPELGGDEIYQSIFDEGYYYNISPLYPDGDRNRVRIGLLRGAFELDDRKPDRLNVHFIRYPGINGRPDLPIWQLAPLAEQGRLDHEIAIVPRLIVWLFFGSGALDEVYTDQDLRICYGSDGDDGSPRALYVMTRTE